MSVPETAVHKHDRSETGEDQIGAARQVLAVEPEAQPSTVQAGAQCEFWLGVASSDAAHVEPSLFEGQNVGHTFLTLSARRDRLCSDCCSGTTDGRGPFISGS